MRILAFESSAKAASVALMQDGVLLAESFQNNGKTHSATLMPMAQQVALLRVLETRMVSRIGDSSQIPVDVRIICATNKNLYDEVKAGRFRSDLYYRLNVINLHIPPLRERKGDIYLLIGAFIKKFGSGNFNKKESFSDEKLIAFYEYDWPGNVRELQNVLERMMYFPEHMTRHFY